MKKLLVLALAVVMVLAFAAVSMAATVTFTGEADFMYNLNADPAPATQDNEFDLVSTVALNDVVTVAGGFQAADGVAKVKAISVAIKTSDTGKLSFYNDSFNMGGDMDCLTKGNADISSNFGIKYEDTLAEGVTINAGIYPSVNGLDKDGKKLSDVGAGDPVMGIGLGVAYAADALGLSFGYSKGNTDTAGMVINADYKLGEFKPFVQYGAPQVKDADAVNYVGCLYQQADGPFGARLEYCLTANAKDSNDMAVYLDYKVNGVLFRLTNKTVTDVTTQQIKVNVAF